jgi:multiple sugar transport system substrate-binding protein
MKKNQGLLIVVALIIAGLIVNFIYIMNKKVEIALYFHPDKLGFISKSIEEFERMNPKIKIKLIELPDDTNEKYEVLNSALALEDGSIDIIDSDVIWPAIFVEAGWVEPLGQYFGENELNSILQSAIDAGTINNTLYGIPYRIDSGMLFYRSDLLEKYNQSVPKTWNELIKTSQIIMEKEENMYGLAGSWYEYEGLTCNYLEFLWGNNGEVFSDGDTLSLDSQEAKEALGIMVDMIYKYGVVPPDVTTYTSGDVRKQFLSGNLIFMRDWPAGWRYVSAEDSDIKGKVKTAPLPTFSTDIDSSGTLGGWMFMVSKHSKHKEESVEFIKFMISEEKEREMAKTHSYLPVVKSLYSDSEIVEQMPFLDKMLPFFNQAKPRPRVAYYDKISYILQNEVTKALTGQVDPDDASDNIQNRISK